jgi:hypothetical protein
VIGVVAMTAHVVWDWRAVPKLSTIRLDLYGTLRVLRMSPSHAWRPSGGLVATGRETDAQWRRPCPLLLSVAVRAQRHCRSTYTGRQCDRCYLKDRISVGTRPVSLSLPQRGEPVPLGVLGGYPTGVVNVKFARRDCLFFVQISGRLLSSLAVQVEEHGVPHLPVFVVARRLGNWRTPRCTCLCCFVPIKLAVHQT